MVAALQLPLEPALVFDQPAVYQDTSALPSLPIVAEKSCPSPHCTNSRMETIQESACLSVAGNFPPHSSAVNLYNVMKDIEVNCVQSAIGYKINANKARRLTQKLANAQLIAQLVAYSARSVQRVTME